MPATSRLLAIGDIHGCAYALDALLAAVDPQPRDQVVTLGDYVDRGLDSCGVLNRLLRLGERCRHIALRGNHEEMMLAAREDKTSEQFWLNCGGDATLISYSPFDDDGTLADVPDDHWDFMANVCRDYWETDTHIFVHGGLKPDEPVHRQHPSVLRWLTLDQLRPHCSGKTIICGHTPLPAGKPRDLGYAIAIDTGAHNGGWLTCLDVLNRIVIQASERREVRRLAL